MIKNKLNGLLVMALAAFFLIMTSCRETKKDDNQSNEHMNDNTHIQENVEHMEADGHMEDDGHMMDDTHNAGSHQHTDDSESH
jgi:ABC-type nickel/cobalt efflux system permease component RcnA